MADVNELIVSLGDATTDSSSADPPTTNEEPSSDNEKEHSVVRTGDNGENNDEGGATNFLSPPNGEAKTAPLRKKKTVSFNDAERSSSRDSKSKDPPLDEESLLLASTLVLDAKRGRNLEYILGNKYVKSYIFYNEPFLRWILYVFIALDLTLAIFEEPAVPNASIPYWGTMVMEFACMCYFSFRILHAMFFQYSRVFFKDAKNIIVMVSIVLTLIDMICYIIWQNMSPDTHPVRWSRPLRPLFIVNFPDGKQIRRAFRNIRRTVPDIMNVLFLFLMSVLLFGLLALKLFAKRGLKYPTGIPYFSNYFDSIWDLYVLVTTANNPDVMMPAYDYSKWFFIFFLIYLILCLYIFMSIVLATIYNNYKKNLKNEIRAAVFTKRKQLAKAFDILKVSRHDEHVITHSRWKQLMGLLLPNKSAAHTDLLMKILDTGNKNVLDKKDFLHLSDLLHLPLSEVKDRQTLFEKYFPDVYNHRYSELFKRFVRHKAFRYLFDFLIVINAVFIAIDLDVADWFFLSIFTVEILCKLYVFGAKEFFLRFWNIFDFLVIGSALMASIIEKATEKANEEISTLDVLLVLRVMRLVKIFGSIKRFKVILQTLVNIGPSIVTYGGVIFVFYYFFAIIGMELFSGYIHYYGYDEQYIGSHGTNKMLFCGNVKLNNSLFYKAHYCNNNFNDIVQSMVVMFELSVVNQWHVITSGFVLVTSKVARLYFFAFHLCCVVVVLNIFIAFILEAFILEYTLQTVPKLESLVEAKIKELGLGIGMKPRSASIQGPSGDKIELVDEEVLPETDVEGGGEGDGEDQGDDSDTDSIPDLSKEKGLKFHLKKKSRKKVEVLLQHMFQGEIDDDDEGPSDLENIDSYRKNRKLTLEEVT
ncbi:two pore calcium channel protein 1 [Aplysia californica]|uniref:Two pore calcium channel protein 1 n=1 Tax=Aplysia californica TaxID=6500 RepID=A0ABM1A837_APLCA|nr:two pore calcium channel protein 1 [Aplysia californica]